MDIAIEFVVFIVFYKNILLCSVGLYNILYKSIENLSRQTISIEYVVFISCIYKIYTIFCRIL